MKEHYGPNLDSLHTSHTVGILVDDDNTLHLYVNGVDQGVAGRDIPQTCYVILDLYGQCEQVRAYRELMESFTFLVLFKI